MQCKIKRQKVAVSKKVPIPGVQYSSQTYGIETELEFIPDEGESRRQFREEALKAVEREKERLENRIDRWIWGEDGEEPDVPDPPVKENDEELTAENQNPPLTPPESKASSPSEDEGEGRKSAEHPGPEWLVRAFREYTNYSTESYLDPPPSTDKQIRFLKSLTSEEDRRLICEKYGVGELKELTVGRASKLISALQKRRQKV